MENRLRIKLAQEEVIAELLERLNKKGFVVNCWFDPDGMLHVVIRSRETLEDPKKLREFWKKYFDNGVEDLELT